MTTHTDTFATTVEIHEFPEQEFVCEELVVGRGTYEAYRHPANPTKKDHGQVLLHHVVRAHAFAFSTGGVHLTLRDDQGIGHTFALNADEGQDILAMLSEALANPQRL